MRAAALLVILSCSVANALQAVSPARALRPATSVRTAPSMQFGKKKLTAAEKLEEMGYWPGEWLCADCGFIYEVGNDPPFEELKSFWKCPQCAGPRRRFVKKAGDMCASESRVEDATARRLGLHRHASARPTRLTLTPALALSLSLTALRCSARRVGTLDDSTLYQATAAFAVVLIGLVYLGLTA